MKLLSFLLEHDRAAKRVSRLPLETSSSARLRLTLNFWDAGEEEHTIEVISQQPNATARTLAVVYESCHRGVGLFRVELQLPPLELAGWHELQLVVDGEFPVRAMRMHVLGPRREVVNRYMGRPPLVKRRMDGLESLDSRRARFRGRS